MKIRVVLFAILKDAAGTGAVVLELPEQATAGDIRGPLIEKYPSLAQYIHRVAFAVNQTYASIDAKLNPGDEVALIPPVSGGSEVDLFRSRVREVLLADWDPTNASRSEAAAGTYDGYISPICDLIRSGAGEEAMIDFLYEREREIMCFPGLGKQRLRRVAQRLLSLAKDK